MERRWYQYYDKEVPPSIEYPRITIKELFISHAETNPEKPYLIFNDIQISYKAANSMARRFANSLADKGVRKGDRIALMMPNIPQYPVTLMAVYKMGAIAVPTNPLYTVPELTHQFKDSGAETVVVMAAFAEKVIAILREGKTSVKRVVIVQIPGNKIEFPEDSAILDFDQCVGSGKDEEPAVEIGYEDVVLLQYTGGTTGLSKGCMLTNSNMISMIQQTGMWHAVAVPPEEMKTLATIPLYHVFGMNCNINLCLYGGGTMVLVAQPAPDNILAAINRSKPNCWAAVPAMIQGVANHPDITKSEIKSMEGITSGGSPLAVELLNKFQELSGARITEGYGLSETCNIITANPMTTIRKAGSVGVPWPDVDLKIVDLDTGLKEMPTGEPGEIIARAPQIMKGYWENPEETANTLIDGWLFTGDIGYMDEDGFVFIVDRKKDMLLCSGFNVYPRDIDEVMYTNPKVLEACTIGVKDEKRGETVKVFVVLKEGETMTEEEVIDYCKERLAPYKVPKIVEFINEVPRTSVGKPDRKILRAMDEQKSPR
ncbi:MAG TPA: long-chain fatty acid--CoA ligase [Spirochaetota bacterium]|nr:long-chain fatty acid--CoA ligase [Spirochaetota bacterium]HPJ35276.1 long-chain fatty acid--CoA ligase [Spirochaetota bacterium]